MDFLLGYPEGGCGAWKTASRVGFRGDSYGVEESDYDPWAMKSRHLRCHPAEMGLWIQLPTSLKMPAASKPSASAAF